MLAKIKLKLDIFAKDRAIPTDMIDGDKFLKLKTIVPLASFAPTFITNDGGWLMNDFIPVVYQCKTF